MALHQVHPSQLPQVWPVAAVLLQKAIDLEPEMITISVPEPKKVWRILYLKSETSPHRCNPRDDYQKLQQMALVKKQNDTMQKWLEKNRNKFYVYVGDSFKNCDELKPWLKK
jgi:peptidyl-prolyl cis-trans isomerase SurA